ncbi:unnamed protein product [Aureobasidium vineae]|uniref:Integral membrane protein n=1 Tax=Aureobasidium vineae TaxID=2773715 RepID=A0A9N8P4J6_9PEZI|nr:unnamed protein product [Aureobasidium vineae]
MSSSVKFDVKETVASVTGKQDLANEVGNAITKGAGAGGYLALQSNPLRTKMITSGSLSGVQEVLASWIAKDRNKNGHYFTSRVPKMALYGAFVSAPLGHILINILQKAFAGRTSLKAKILQILASNLIVAPIQNTIYLSAMAIIAGARTFHQVRATVRAGLLPVMKKFLPQETWVPFFNIIAFVIGTYINAHTKKKRLAALRKKHYGDSRSTGRPEDDRRPNF